MNPTEVMVEKALKMGYALENIQVVSLGTGKLAEHMYKDDAKACEDLYWPAKYQKSVGIDELPYKQVQDVDAKMKEKLK